MQRLKYTKIIATLGPACSDVESMRTLIASGVDCFRLNFSHGDGEALSPLIGRAREAAAAEGRHITLLADVQGPKLRIGKLPAQGVLLRDDEPFVITTHDIVGDEHHVHSPYRWLLKDLEPGATVLFADGAIELEVERIEEEEVHCRVVSGGRLYSNKGLNMPGRRLSVQTLTDKDRRDLAFIASADIDIVAVSFVRSPADIEQARQVLNNRRIPVMAKLERPEALECLDAILDGSDGVMVARGDLGVELPFAQVPLLQKRILAGAARRGKWAVVATQMLGSMVTARRPSRAEASDVVNAVLDGADAVMLSEETAVGSHPAGAVRAMAALTQSAERQLPARAEQEMDAELVGFALGAAGAAVAAAERINARALVTLAGSGLTALALSKQHSRLPIVALGSFRPTLNRLNVLRGVVPVPIENRTDFEEQLIAADRHLIAAGWASAGDTVIVAAAMPLGEGKETNTIRFHRVRAAP
ncbi:MAG: pyruvate kinase [Myxococcales bacterium]|nr:pyruvate kinase [Myxococcales bacterium]